MNKELSKIKDLQEAEKKYQLFLAAHCAYIAVEDQATTTIEHLVSFIKLVFYNRASVVNLF